jgi:hypothetical protein
MRNDTQTVATPAAADASLPSSQNGVRSVRYCLTRSTGAAKRPESFPMTK